MKVQPIKTKKGIRYILIGNDYKPEPVVTRYLKYLDNLGKSPNTQRSYAYDLLLYCEFMEQQGIPLLDLCKNPDKGPVDIMGEFVLNPPPSGADRRFEVCQRRNVQGQMRKIGTGKR